MSTESEFGRHKAASVFFLSSYNKKNNITETLKEEEEPAQ